MIWFGKLPGIRIPELSPPERPHRRMRQALECVACHAPGLSGAALVQALASTGWVDETTAERLLPEFRHFDSERHFAQNLRSLSFRGRSMEDEFRRAVARAMEDIVGPARGEGEEESAEHRFGDEEWQGTALAFPEVRCSISGRIRELVAAAAEQMPDTFVLIARNFDPEAHAQLSALLGREIPGTLMTVNQLLGIRAMALRYHPAPARVRELLAIGRALRSADIARLGDRD
jgi:hypothetical protein